MLLAESWCIFTNITPPCLLLALLQSTLEGHVFDVVLLDEASQMTEPTSLVSIILDAAADDRRQPCVGDVVVGWHVLSHCSSCGVSCHCIWVGVQLANVCMGCPCNAGAPAASQAPVSWPGPACAVGHPFASAQVFSRAHQQLCDDDIT